jgi:hypothetical protein
MLAKIPAANLTKNVGIVTNASLRRSMGYIRNAWRRLRAGRFPCKGGGLFGKNNSTTDGHGRGETQRRRGRKEAQRKDFSANLRVLCASAFVFVRVNPCPSVVKKRNRKKKKVAFPQRTWQIKPVTRVKFSVKAFASPSQKELEAVR